MASLVLTTVGGALGGAIGGPIGLALGQAGGGLAGSALGLGGGSSRAGTRLSVGPRLTTLNGIGSTEGASITRTYGRVRVGGEMIWATRFSEQANYSFQPASGGKGGQAQPYQPAQISVSYAYYANFAIGLCEGPVAFLRRVWADGQELDLTTITFRFYGGTEDQDADPLITAVEASGTVPAYRGLAYVVFESFPIGGYGNRVPQMTFEVVRPAEGVAQMIRAVNIIPGGTEFGYSPSLHISIPGPGTTVAENRNQLFAASDWKGSIDALQALCPNLTNVALIVVWFGDDLRAGHCTIAPRVDNGFKTLSWPFIPQFIDDWSVAGLSRPTARLTSFVDGTAAFGGTPSDASVIAALGDLKARGLSAVLYPFVMMDIPPGNTLADPWTGATSQPAFPWRGRITCDPAPGMAGTPDGTAAADIQVAAFFSGYSPFVMHCAVLAKAGGADGFLIGSELATLTRVRSSAGVYPAVDALVSLAAQAKSYLGAGVKITYGADWTEYGAHVRDGGAEIRFPLDALWMSSSIDAVGIDAYWPLADWRDGDHLDAGVAASTYDLAYLGDRLTAGEAYDWYYADDIGRAAQTRLPITDGAYGKPWVFRQKDIASWWSNTHVQRIAGIETAATAWTPGAKPIWLTETGCPAVDRGANAPNLFPDPKSSEGGLPPFSRGFRDDLMQARFLEATLSHYDSAQAGFSGSNNPIGPQGFRMVDAARIFIWAWNARPFPAFPALSSLWADSADWRTGHWLNGRLEGLPLDRLLAALCAEVDLPAAARVRPDVEGFVDGYVLDRPMSMRSAIDPLSDLFGFDAVVSSGQARFVSRARLPSIALTEDDIVPAKDGALILLTRAQETELPHEIAVSFGDSENAYAPANVLSRRIEGWSSRQAQAESAVMTYRGAAQRSVDAMLDDIWIARETATFDLDPRLLALEPGDVLAIHNGGVTRDLRITEIVDGASRSIHARAIDAALFDRGAPDSVPMPTMRPPVVGPPHVVVLDLAIARNDPVALQYIAVAADPWPGALNLYRSIGGVTNELVAALTRKGTIGVVLDALPPGPVSRFDRGTRMRVKLYSGALASVTDQQVLGGSNTFAIRGSDGAWEIFAAANAELIAADTYRLSRLLRGLGGEEGLAGRSVAAGAPIVLLDEAVTPLASGLAALGSTTTWRIGPVNRDPADASYVTIAPTVSPKALMPYAPVHAKATRSSDGIVVCWTRRGRIDADAWEPLDIPLGEAIELYSVAIVRPVGPPRVLQATTLTVLYAAADILADFGFSPPMSLDVTINEISAAVGAGFSLAAHLPVG